MCRNKAKMDYNAFLTLFEERKSANTESVKPKILSLKEIIESRSKEPKMYKTRAKIHLKSKISPMRSQNLSSIKNPFGREKGKSYLKYFSKKILKKTVTKQYDYHKISHQSSEEKITNPYSEVCSNSSLISKSSAVKIRTRRMNDRISAALQYKRNIGKLLTQKNNLSLCNIKQVTKANHSQQLASPILENPEAPVYRSMSREKTTLSEIKLPSSNFGLSSLKSLKNSYKNLQNPKNYTSLK